MPCFARGCHASDPHERSFTLRFGQGACLCALHSPAAMPRLRPPAERPPMPPAPCCSAAGPHTCLQARFTCDTCEAELCGLCAERCHAGHALRTDGAVSFRCECTSCSVRPPDANKTLSELRRRLADPLYSKCR